MPISWDEIRDKVVIGIISAVALGGLTLIWNWASSGGVVRAFGGVTQRELDAALKNISGVPGPPGPKGEPGTSANLPNAVIAFESHQCPPGWSLFSDAMGRSIIGADPIGWTGGRNLDENNHPLSSRDFRATGGAEKHTLRREELPAISLSVTVPSPDQSGVDKYNAGGHNYPVITKGSTTVQTAPLGNAQEIQRMIPFIALLYCKKD